MYFIFSFRNVYLTQQRVTTPRAGQTEEEGGKIQKDFTTKDRLRVLKSKMNRSLYPLSGKVLRDLRLTGFLKYRNG